MKPAIDYQRQTMGQSSLSHARHILHQQMTPGEESDQTLFYHFCFAFDNGLNGLHQAVDLFLLFDFQQKVPPSPPQPLRLPTERPSTVQGFRYVMNRPGKILAVKNRRGKRKALARKLSIHG